MKLTTMQKKKETITGEEFMNILNTLRTSAPVVENTNEEGSSVLLLR